MMTTMTVGEIEALIPHRPPMRLVDAVLEREGARIVTTKTFTPDEWFFQGHYPGTPLVPGVILCECGMQAGAILLAGFAAEAEPGSVPVATRLDNVRLKQMVRPGDTITCDVTLTERVSGAFYLTCKMSRDGRSVARFDFACTMAPGPAA